MKLEETTNKFTPIFMTFFNFLIKFVNSRFWIRVINLDPDQSNLFRSVSATLLTCYSSHLLAKKRGQLTSQ